MGGTVYNEGYRGRIGAGFAGVSGSALVGFVSSWKTNNAGASNDDQITIPTKSGGTWDATVDWGDGNIETGFITYNDSRWTHTYAAEGTYTVSITGDTNGLAFNNSGDKAKLLEILQWDSVPIATSGCFWGCSNLTISATDSPEITTTDPYYLFRGCSSLVDVPSFGDWDFSGVTRFWKIFDSCTSFVGTNSNLNSLVLPSSCTSLLAMFSNCNSFNGDVSSWDTQYITIMTEVFSLNTVFNQDIGGWDVSSVTSFSSMFNTALAFNQDLSGWVTTAATTFNSMFYKNDVFDQDISGWDLDGATDIVAMFRFCDGFDQDLSDWDLTTITSAANFRGNGGGFSTANYDAMLIAWDLEPTYNSFSLSMGASEYTGGGAAETARTSLIAKGITISDSGMA